MSANVNSESAVADSVAVQHIAAHGHRDSRPPQAHLDHARCRAPAPRDRAVLERLDRPAGCAGRIGRRFAHGPCSSALEVGRALLGECGDAFGIVRRSAELALQVALDVELLARACAASRRGSPPWSPRVPASARRRVAARAHRPSRRTPHRRRIARSFPRRPPARPDSFSPSSVKPSARASPTRRGKLHVPPESGTRPSRQNA